MLEAVEAVVVLVLLLVGLAERVAAVLVVQEMELHHNPFPVLTVLAVVAGVALKMPLLPLLAQQGVPVLSSSNLIKVNDE
jgi:hypothetical protein